MLQQETPDDYVISTGRMESVRKFIEICAIKLKWNCTPNGPGIFWKGQGIEEVGIRANTKEIVDRVNKRYFRPTEVDKLLGDSEKEFKKLGWEPKTTLEELIEDMINFDKNEAKKELFLREKNL